LIVERSIPAGTYHDAWDSETLDADARRVLGVEAPITEWFAEDGIAEPEIEARLIDAADRHMAEKAVRLGPDIMRMAEKNLLLQVLDQQWKEHLLTLDQLRQGITLRAYGQKDPLNEYKREAFLMFETMLANMRETTSMVLSHVEIRQSNDDGAPPAAPAEASANAKVSRNVRCPCGSGKKFKHCHGAL